MSSEGDLVAHCAGHDEEGGLFAGKGGDVGFESVGGGVFEEDIVEEGGVLDGAEHGGGGRGHGIRTEVELRGAIARSMPRGYFLGAIGGVWLIFDGVAVGGGHAERPVGSEDTRDVAGCRRSYCES